MPVARRKWRWTVRRLMASQSPASAAATAVSRANTPATDRRATSDSALSKDGYSQAEPSSQKVRRLAGRSTS
jgi:hypothetical protein